MFEHQLKTIETKDRTQTILLRMFVHTLETSSHLSKFHYVPLSEHLWETIWSSVIKESHGDHLKFKQINLDKKSLATFILLKHALMKTT